MGFPQRVADEVFVRCGRHCCLCGIYAGQKMELHHIKQAADGGDDSIDNCIPLCCNCHAEVRAYDPRHPKGRKFTEAELRGHRDKYYAQYGTVSNMPSTIDAADAFMDWFDRSASDAEDNPVWGYPDLDRRIPLTPGAVILIAGYTGSGKSIFAQHVVRKNLLDSKRTVYFHLKDSSEQVLNTILAAESLVKVSSLQRNLLTAEEWQRLSCATSALNIKNLKFIPFDITSPVQEQVVAVVKNSQANLVVVDDIGALGLYDDASREAFMYKLKSAATASGTIVLLLSNIALKNFRFDDRPVLSDFDTDSIYRFCDVVQFVYRDTYAEPSTSSITKVEIITAKSVSQQANGTMIAAGLPDYPIISPIADNTTLD